MKYSIKLLRVMKGLNQQELATALGVTQGAVSQWETGLSKPGSKMIPLLAEALECTPDQILACFDEK